MTTPSATNHACPCGSEITLGQCCLPLIQGKKKASTAEALLRSRYTAFVRGDTDYILSTHHTRTKSDVNREGIEEWSKKSEWLGLQILEQEAGTEKDEQGKIAFHVQYKVEGKLNDHRELSLFEKENGEWRFLDAQAAHPGTLVRAEPKIGRNDPCKCGSGKKFKKCCGAHSPG